MRHGHSQANEKHIIISSPQLGVSQYGLSDKGRDEVRHSIEAFQQEDRDYLIYSSDFLRTTETAKIVAQYLGVEEIHFRKELRERYFGDFDNDSDSHYKQVWEKDKFDGMNSAFHVESPLKVAFRTEKLLRELDRIHNRKNIILISHGDCLQILQTVFSGKSPQSHRSLPHLGTAEIRELKHTTLKEELHH